MVSIKVNVLSFFFFLVTGEMVFGHRGDKQGSLQKDIEKIPTIYLLEGNEYGSNANRSEINGWYSLVSVIFGQG